MRAATEASKPATDLAHKFDHICFVDVETTGLDATKHIIIELACVRVHAVTLEIVGTYEAKIRPGIIEIQAASPEALQVNGYTPERWKDAVHPSTALTKAAKLMQYATLAGHNVQFDKRFFDAAFKSRSVPSPLVSEELICTKQLAEKYINKAGPGSYKLEDLARYFNLRQDDAHSALPDAIRSFELYKRLRQHAADLGRPVFSDAPRPPSQPPPAPKKVDTLPMFAPVSLSEGTTVDATPPPEVATVAAPPPPPTPAVAPASILEAHKAMKATPPAAAAPAARTGKLVVSRGKIASPVRALIYGVEGVGKSSCAAAADNPIFLCKEAGTEQLDIARFPEPTHWRDAPASADGRRLDVFSLISELRTSEHDFKTLVLDTVDWIEPLIFKHICKTNPKGAVHSIELAYDGYGKGYVVAVDEWRALLALLDTLRKERGMHVILLGHAHVKKYSNPEGEDYDRYTLKMNEKAAGLLKEWCDAVLFAQQQFFAVDKKNTQKGKFGTGTNKREMFTERRAAWDAKNRYDLPPKMDLSWPQLMMYVNKATPQGVDTLITHLKEQMAFTSAEVQVEAQGMIDRVGRDADKIMQILAWVQSNQVVAAD